MKQAILLISETGLDVARTISRELHNAPIYTQKNVEGCHTVSSFDTFLQEHFAELDALIHVGALGICVRHIAPYIKNKYKDPAVVCVDSTGRFAVPVLSGHIGGANELAEQIAQMMGGEAVVTTQSDNTDLWALDTLGKKYDWQTPQSRASMNKCIYHFVERRPTALLLDIRDRGTAYLERTCPAHVKIFYRYEDIAFEQFALLITVSPWIHHAPIDTLEFHPRVLRLGVGCRKDAHPEGIAAYISDKLEAHGLSPLSLAGIATIELKKDEPLLPALQSAFPHTDLQIFRPDDLRDIEIPNPSEKVLTTTGVAGVAETTAIRAANYGPLVLEKQKGEVTEGNQFTFAVAMDAASLRQGHIEIVGAGPGDPELISVRGRHFLEQADLILYAGSLVPKELTFCAKEGATVRSSASMTLEEQFDLMKSFYDRGLLVVRLHTGDPCIYGAIEEQMNFFDQHRMDYHITPGISSFQAAAAELRSQFTIPERVQTIILTRGEGRTPMPEREKLHLLARSQSTMCIYLSAAIADKVQAELLECYPPTTPVAACYKLTWKEQRIYRGQLKDLADIVKEHNLTLTTLLVVGDAIDNREGLSRLYSHEFKHLYRP
ncbi:precorrin-4 C(11)-methyltransferase [Phocaeicola coprophilus]|nr:precorrin-4 C(11)-methyltransferase [Phocaeicola coprophilus]